MGKSLLVAIEGLDNSGKSTQCARLADTLRNRNISVLRNDPASQCVHEVLADAFKKPGFSPERQTLLFAAELLEFFNAEAFTALETADAVVICDRYVYSIESYAVAQGLSGRWLRTVTSVFPKPDMTFYLDISVEEYERRIAGDTSRESPHPTVILQKVRQHYLALAHEYDFTVIDGQQPITVISEEILKEINCLLML